MCLKKNKTFIIFINLFLRQGKNIYMKTSFTRSIFFKDREQAFIIKVNVLCLFFLSGDV